MMVTALRDLDGDGAIFGNEYVLRLHVLAARAAKPHHVPVVDDRVVFARQQEHSVLADLGLASYDTAEHVPCARIDTAREGPTPAQAITARDAPRLSRGEHHRRGDQYVTVRAPDLVLAHDRPEREHPVVHRVVGPVPG